MALKTRNEQLTIKTDIKVELISTIIYLSNMQEKGIVVSAEELGSDAIDNRFAEFKNHPAITMYPKLWDIGLWYDQIPLLALYLTDEIKLQDSYWQKDGYDNWMPEEKAKILDFVSHLHNFYYEANFEQYYKETLPENTEFIAVLNDLLTAIPLQRILEDYIGEKLPQTNVRLMNLLKSSFGVRTGDTVNRQIYCFCSRHWLRVGHKNNYLKINFYNTVWHEFLHSVINPLSDQLFPGGITATEEQSTWYCALNESIIWAITYRLCHLNGIVSDKDNSWFFDNARRNKAPKAEELYALLFEYESNRDKFPGIKDFHVFLQQEFGSVPI